MPDLPHDQETYDRGVEARGKMLYRYVAQVIIGDPEAPTTSINSGSAVIVRAPDNLIVVTADHVIRGYESKVESNAAVRLQIGQMGFSIAGRPNWRSERDDIAVFLITEVEAKRIGTEIHVPPVWPPHIPPEGSSVIVVGLPEETRSVVDTSFIRFGPLVAELPVKSAFENHFTCLIDRAELVSALDRPLPPAPVRFGGISGGPVFLDATLHFPLVGIVKEVFEEREYFVVQGLANVPRVG